MRNARVDANHSELVRLLQRAGCSVESLHRVGGGVPDLLVGRAYKNFLIEIKTESGRLESTQIVWHRDWRGQVATARTIDDALRIVGLL